MIFKYLFNQHTAVHLTAFLLAVIFVLITHRMYICYHWDSQKSLTAYETLEGVLCHSSAQDSVSLVLFSTGGGAILQTTEFGFRVVHFLDEFRAGGECITS